MYTSSSAIAENARFTYLLSESLAHGRIVAQCADMAQCADTQDLPITSK